MPRNQEIKKVLVIGSGPIVIGQAAEFDYAGTQACRSLKEEGVEVVLVNSNPATIMTDKDIADQVYIEPLTVPVLEQIIAKEKPDSILPTLGGQAGLNLGMELSEKGILDKYGGSLARTQATGYGLLYLTNALLKDHGIDIAGKTCAVSGSGNVAIYAIEKAHQLGAKVVTCSDSTGWIYDPEGIDVALLKEVKEVKRARLTEYAAARPSAEYHAKQNGEHGVWQYKVDLALPCATQNELDIEDAKMLVANGVTSVTEGANMPTTLEATKYLQANGVLFVGGKAANAGGVATSALEMSQNSERLSWTFEEVDGKLKGIMETIYANISDAAKRYNATVGGQTDYVAGANIAGFEKVVDAMLAQGVC